PDWISCAESSTEMRLFVAIEISAEIRQRINGFVTQARSRVTNARWVHPDGLHITLKFLGIVGEEKRPLIEQTLCQIHATRFEVSLEKIGVFPNPRSPRVLWVGVESGPELAILATGTDQALASVGFEREKRPFTPHVTVARFKETTRTRSVDSVLAEPSLSFGTMTATEFHLYESKLSPKGASYSQLASFALS